MQLIAKTLLGCGKICVLFAVEMLSPKSNIMHVLSSMPCPVGEQWLRYNVSRPLMYSRTTLHRQHRKHNKRPWQAAS